jgi:Zn finger protein HypA/HybF involved in hydrogenase expression
MKKKIVKSNGKSIWAGTFLEEVEKAMRSKKLSLPELDPVGRNEVVIGKMTRLEKTLKILAFAKIKEGQAICDACSCSPAEKKSDACRKVKSLSGKIEILGNMAWELIKNRLKCHGDNLRIRKGDKITKDLRPLILELPEHIRALAGLRI